jgi:prophage tail gpP-like protein
MLRNSSEDTSAAESLAGWHMARLIGRGHTPHAAQSGHRLTRHRQSAMGHVVAVEGPSDTIQH